MATKAAGWNFPAHFRQGQYNWRGSSLAAKRLGAAVKEIQARARVDPETAAEGSVRLLERLVPAIEHIDSSSGQIGRAVHEAVEELAGVLEAADVSDRKREAWLERLWQAYEDDGYAYLESIGALWGRFCASPEVASRWADELMPLVRRVNAERRAGNYVHSNATAACLSALLAAGRHADLLALIDELYKPMWHDLRYGVEALSAMGDLEAALRMAEASRSSAGYYEDAIDAACEAILLEQGRTEEAYRRFGLRGHRRNTNLATFRAVAAAYPTIPPSKVLADLIADSPGEEGRWFAAAKASGELGLALRLAETSPVDVRTLVRAARDAREREPRFALGCALAALRWMCAGQFYEITGSDVQDAVSHALNAAERVEGWDRRRAARSIDALLAVDQSSKAFVRTIAARDVRRELEK